MASAVPEKADPAVTVISGANVLATIVLPNNNGAAISLVNWYVANSLGVFVKIEAYCSSDATPFCAIPM